MSYRILRLTVFFVAAHAVLAVAGQARGREEAATAQRLRAGTATTSAILLTNGTLIDGTGSAALENAWVRVEGDRIVEVGHGTPPAARGAQVIDVNGKTIMPGLADMHAHLGPLPQARWMLKLMLAHGITTVRDVGNTLGDLAEIRRWVADPEVVVPHLYVSGIVFPGGGLERNLEFLKAGPELAARLNEELAFGVDFIKIHNFISTAALKQMAAFCKEHDIPLIGHTPINGTTVAAIDAGMWTLEHVRLRPSEITDDPEVEARFPMDLLIMPRENHWAFYDPKAVKAQRTLDAWAKRKDQFFVDPTLVTHEMLAYGDDPKVTDSPDLALVSPAMRQQWGGGSEKAYGTLDGPGYELAKRAAKNMGIFIGLAHARGVRILTGTDTPVNWVVPGVSLLHELELLVQGGLSPVQAIQASTGNAAQALRKSTGNTAHPRHKANRGTIAPDQMADLVIVDGNVATDITKVRQIERVMLDGHLYERAQLLQDAAKLAAADDNPRRSHRD